MKKKSRKMMSGISIPLDSQNNMLEINSIFNYVY